MADITAMADPLNLLATTTRWESGSTQKKIRLTNQHEASCKNATRGTLARTDRSGTTRHTGTTNQSTQLWICRRCPSQTKEKCTQPCLP